MLSNVFKCRNGPYLEKECFVEVLAMRFSIHLTFDRIKFAFGMRRGYN